MVCSEHIAKGGKDDTSQKEIATELFKGLVGLTRWKCVEIKDHEAPTSH
jgi:hypothetical protein